MMNAEIKKAAIDRGIKNTLVKLCEITGKSAACISFRLNGKTQWQADEIRAIREAWNLSAEETCRLFVDNA